MMHNPGMQILAGQIRPDSIVLSGKIPSLTIGKTLVVTVLSAPKSGRVLVSMFGKHIRVETTMALHKGQVLNLKVHALSPRIVLKPAGAGADTPEGGWRDAGSVMGRLAGSLGEKPVEAFLIQEILGRLFSQARGDASRNQAMASLIEQVLEYPQALAFLFIPLVGDGSQGSARVWIERDGGAYALQFRIETDHLGSLECTARVDQAIDIEIRTPLPETADLLNLHVHELQQSLEPFGVRHVGICLATLREGPLQGVDVLV